jgi:hypothetical protein
MPIVPDDKNWTWVIEQPCNDCGYDPATIDIAELGDHLRANVEQWPPLLAHEHVRLRPTDDQWSALEYACHVRDVFAVYAERLERTLAEETPELESMRRDERAVRDRYNEQQPAPVADQLTKNAEHLAARLERLTEADWERTAILSYPEPAPRTVLWMARRVAHEGNHHLLDIGRVLRTVRAR